VGIVAGMLLGEASKSILPILDNHRAALTIGWTLGAMIGGAMVSAVGLRARDAFIGPWRQAG
jgi:hypothetical protein